MMAVREKTFLEFFSPGTFSSESSTREISGEDIAAAVEMANGIKERHGAKPYGFRFQRCLVGDPIPDGRGGEMRVETKEISRSGTHYLGGKLIRFDEVPDDREHNILRSNMRCSRMPIVIENNNSWRFTGEFREEDCIVDADGSVIVRGNDPALMEYRRKKNAEFAAS